MSAVIRQKEVSAMAGALIKDHVLLGYPDEEIQDGSSTDYSVSKLGGLPVSNYETKSGTI